MRADVQDPAGSILTPPNSEKPTPGKLKKVLARFRRDPVFFVTYAFNVEPTHQQAQILRAIAKPGAKVSVSSGHGIGKTAALAWAIDWFLLFFPHCRIPCTAPTSSQLHSVLWAELKRWHSVMEEPWKSELKVMKDKVIVVSDPDRFAVARTARKEDAEALQGFHAKNLLFIIDEASGVHDKIFESARGSLSTKRARVLMTSNPTRLQGFFWKSHHRNRNHWTRFQFSSEDSPLVDKAYVEEIREEYGDDSDYFRVRVAGKFPRAAISQLISLELAEAAARRKLGKSDYYFAPVVLGVDVAWEGDDRSVVVLRQGLHSRVLGHWRNLSTMALGDLVAQFEDQYQADAVFVDAGWGAGTIDRLRSLNRNPIPVFFGESAMEQKRFANKRAEMWVRLLEWLQHGGQIPDMPELIEDLTGPMKMFSPSGKIQLERKEDMKKRGLASPDFGDALALTFASPVSRKKPIETRLSLDYIQDHAEYEYDVLSLED